MSSCTNETLLFSFVSLLLVALFVFSYIYELNKLRNISLLFYFLGAPIILDLLCTCLAISQVRREK